MRYIDLTRPFDATISVYPGDPAPQIIPLNSIEHDGFTSCEVRTGMHVGTHMDAPLHFIAGGKTMEVMPVDRFFGRGILIDVRGKIEANASDLDGIALNKGDIVLLYTGWADRFSTPEYFTDYPDISVSFAEKLVQAGVSIVGSDSASPDHDPFETHKMLLGNDVLIIENLIGLDALLGIENFSVVALPVKFATEATPVRVVACV